eukprot:gene23423-biopygen9370
MLRYLPRRRVQIVQGTEGEDGEAEELELEHGQEDGQRLMVDVAHALTALTIACFVLAMLYDFQYPEDDGLCAAQTTPATCESRKMLLDPFQSQCLWHPPDTATRTAAVLQQIVYGAVAESRAIQSTTAADDAASCRFNDSNDSTVAFLVSYM